MVQPGKVTLALIGDGGMAMSLAELRLLAELDSTVIVIVFRDNPLVLIRSKQERLNLPSYGTTFDGPNIGDIAAAFGLKYFHARTAAQCASATKAAVRAGQPALIEVLVDVAGY